MRIIGSLENQEKALIFSDFLRTKQIAHKIEPHPHLKWDDPDYGAMSFDVWITDEDQVNQANHLLKMYVEHPQDPTFQPPLSPDALTPPSDVADLLFSDSPSSLKTKNEKIIPFPSHPISTPWQQQPMGFVTKSLLIICSALLFFSHYYTSSQTPSNQAVVPQLLFSPVEKALLYDYPHFYELIGRFIHLYGYEELENETDITPQARSLIQIIKQTPYWQGIYSLFLKGGVDGIKKGLETSPLFEKIQQGQVWRLFTPCLLHADIFHLFFNMLWLVVIGKQIEQRLQPLRYILLMVIIAVISNTAQYLMSGPNFVGFSGILCGMLAFIWVRQKEAPWEGYLLDSSTISFMLIFVLGMAAVQFLSFFFEKSLEMAFSPNVANVAHIAGGVSGYFLAKCPIFSWRHQ